MYAVIETGGKQYRVEVGSPTTSALILKELGLSAGAKTKEETVGNITLEQAKKVAASKEASMYGKTMGDKVKQVLGTCKSMGVTCEGQNPMEVIKKINSGEIKI